MSTTGGLTKEKTINCKQRATGKNSLKFLLSFRPQTHLLPGCVGLIKPTGGGVSLKDNKIPLIATLISVVLIATLFWGANAYEKARQEKRERTYQSAVKSYSKADFKPAIKKLEEAAKLNPGDAKSQQLLGNSYEATGKLDEAAKAYQSALKANLNQPDVIYNLAIVYKSQGKIKEAISELEKALKINKNFVAARIVLGDLYAAQGDKAKARKEYTAVVDMKPFGVDSEAIKVKLEGLR